MYKLGQIEKLNTLLTQKERKQALRIFVMVLVMAIFDMAGVASIMPFMMVLLNPMVVETNEILSSVYALIGFSNLDQFFIFLGVAVVLLLFLSLMFKAATIYVQLKFTNTCEYSIGRRLVKKYLSQPYSWFLSQNSADIGKKILSEVGVVVGSSLAPTINLITHSIVSIGLILLLLIVNPMLTLVISSVLGISYMLVYSLVNRKLGALGTYRLEANQARYTAVSESFGAAKEVKMGGLEAVYTKRFARPARRYALINTTATAIHQLPRYVLEVLVFGGLVFIILLYLGSDEGVEEVLPVVSLFALAGYRLMPSLQEIYRCISVIKYTRAALDELSCDMNMADGLCRDEKSVSGSVEVQGDISLKDIMYTYPNGSSPTLEDININISANSTIALVGSTGGGKTTTVDIILGLLEPQQGNLKVGDIVIDASNLHEWQSTIGYVPQHIYLSDSSIAENIAFGVDQEEINNATVERVATIANLHDFVVNELPDGYRTVVGERGVRLSGGQRQRIGIARALYNNPKVLVLDEATSALDNLTELAVMQAVNKLSHDITIILIAHRLSTVKNCDQIYMFDQGKIVQHGTYNELLNKSDEFRLMAET